MKAGLLFLASAALLISGETKAPAGGPFSVSEEPARRDALKRAKQGIDDPVLLESAPVVIPPDWEIPAVGGKVEVTIYIKADGTVHHAEIKSASHPMFIAPVLKAVMKHRYAPTKRDGKPVDRLLSTMVIIPPPRPATDRQKANKAPEPTP